MHAQRTCGDVMMMTSIGLEAKLYGPKAIFDNQLPRLLYYGTRKNIKCLGFKLLTEMATFRSNRIIESPSSVGSSIMILLLVANLQLVGKFIQKFVQ